MFERILVPLDGSARGERIVPLVIHIARRFNSELTLLHVLSPVRTLGTASGPVSASSQTTGNIPYPDELQDRGMSLGSAYLGEVAARIERYGVQTRTSIVMGDAADLISSRATAGRYGMVAMTTTAMPPLFRLFRRGTLRAVWPGVPVPLLVLGDDFDLEQHADSLYPTSLLVLLDGSRMAEWGLLYARRMAQVADLPITLLRSVFRPPFASVDDTEPDPGTAVDASEYLEEKAERLRSVGLSVTTRLTYLEPFRAVVDHQENETPCIVIIASRMRSGWSRAFLGSKADEVIRYSRGAVMIVPARRARKGTRPVEHEAEVLAQQSGEAEGMDRYGT